MSKELSKEMKKNTEERQELFSIGFNAGVRYMMDKIERQYALGKPILAKQFTL